MSMIWSTKSSVLSITSPCPINGSAGIQRQAEIKCGTFTGFTFHPNLTLMLPNDLRAQIKANTETRNMFGIVTLYAVITVENISRSSVPLHEQPRPIQVLNRKSRQPSWNPPGNQTKLIIKTISANPGSILNLPP
jgi:hypothetical protein